MRIAGVLRLRLLPVRSITHATILSRSIDANRSLGMRLIPRTHKAIDRIGGQTGLSRSPLQGGITLSGAMFSLHLTNEYDFNSEPRVNG